MKTMKHVMMMSLSILFLMIGINQVNAQDNNENEKYSHTVLKVKMDCNNCAEAVKTQLAYTKGVKEVKADHVKDLVSVKYVAKKCSEQDLIASLAEIKYEATVYKAQANSSAKKTPCCKQSKKACGGSQTPCSSKKDE